jgi:hypothetical protein
MDVADWLRTLGLEQYEPAFARTRSTQEYCRTYDPVSYDTLCLGYPDRARAHSSAAVAEARD